MVTFVQKKDKGNNNSFSSSKSSKVKKPKKFGSIDNRSLGVEHSRRADFGSSPGFHFSNDFLSSRSNGFITNQDKSFTRISSHSNLGSSKAVDKKHPILRKIKSGQLKVSQPGGKYEREADQMADRVMRKPDGQVIAQSEGLQHNKASQRNTRASSVLTPSGGEPLPQSTREFFEPRFGQDLSYVRVHKGSEAYESARAINARAYTTGQDIVFGAGEYAPETHIGKQLLAHELAHIVHTNKMSNSQKIVYRDNGVRWVEPEEEQTPGNVMVFTERDVLLHTFYNNIVPDVVDEYIQVAFQGIRDHAIEGSQRAIDAMFEPYEERLQRLEYNEQRRQAAVDHLFDLASLVPRSGPFTVPLKIADRVFRNKIERALRQRSEHLSDVRDNIETEVSEGLNATFSNPRTPEFAVARASVLETLQEAYISMVTERGYAEDGPDTRAALMSVVNYMLFPERRGELETQISEFLRERYRPVVQRAVEGPPRRPPTMILPIETRR